MEQQPNNDIFPEKEKKAAKRKKIADMNAVTAQAILGNILNQLGAKYEQYHFRKYCVMIIPIGNGGIEIRMSDSNIIKQRQAMQDKLAKLFDYISGEASLGEVVSYCRDNLITYLGYKARKYAVINKTKKYTAPDRFNKKHKDYSFESAFVLEGVTSIEEGAFGDCESLKSIQLSAGLKSIGEAAFQGCKSLESIQLSEGVSSIGENAFSCCESLKSIKIPAGLRSIEDRAFWGCSGLVSIIVDSNNMVYDSRGNCNAIIETATDTLIVGCPNTVIPVGVTSIGEYAFASCTSLESIQLPEGLQSIGEYAFEGCTSLKSIQLPEGVKSIEDGVFNGCESLESIQLSEGLQSIGEYAFEDCTSLKSIQLPEEVTSIGEYAFWGCESLESIQLSEGVTLIGEYAFENCISLENITFGGTLSRWKQINKYPDWQKHLNRNTVIHCTDGEIKI